MKQQQTQFANAGDVINSQKQNEQNARLAEQDGAPVGTGLDEEVHAQPADHHFDVGSGEEETEDGLDPLTESVRQAAEGEMPDDRAEAEIPVFDRANRSERL